MQTGIILKSSSIIRALYLLWQERSTLYKGLLFLQKNFKQSINFRVRHRERLQRGPIPFVMRFMHQSILLASGEENITLYKLLFHLPVHLFKQSIS